MFFEERNSKSTLLYGKDINFTQEDILKFSVYLGNFLKPHGLVLLINDNSIDSYRNYLALLALDVKIIILEELLPYNYYISIIDRFKCDYVLLPNPYDLYLGEFSNHQSLDSYKLLFRDVKGSISEKSSAKLFIGTSGSTGSQKFVPLSYENLESNCTAIISYLNLTSSDKSIANLPLSYSYGISVLHTLTKVGGGLFVDDVSCTQSRFWSCLKTGGVTLLNGVPYTFELLLQLRFTSKIFENLRVITQAGGRLDEVLKLQLLDYSENNGIDFFVMYGQTEASPRISYVPPKLLRTKINSIGKAISGGSLKIVNSDGVEVEESYVEGQLVYSGPNVAASYVQNKFEVGKLSFSSKELFTGDMGFFDNDGFFYITGRSKRFVKIYGVRVNLDELEIRLRECLKQEVAIIGTDEKILVFVTTSNCFGKVRLFFAENTKIKDASCRFHEIDAIPKLASGKINYSLLKDYYDR